MGSPQSVMDTFSRDYNYVYRISWQTIQELFSGDQSGGPTDIQTYITIPRAMPLAGLEMEGGRSQIIIASNSTIETSNMIRASLFY